MTVTGNLDQEMIGECRLAAKDRLGEVAIVLLRHEDRQALILSEASLRLRLSEPQAGFAQDEEIGACGANDSLHDAGRPLGCVTPFEGGRPEGIVRRCGALSIHGGPQSPHYERIAALDGNEEHGAIVEASDPEGDAKVLPSPTPGIICCREVMRVGRMMRYTGEDDVGLPETAFLVRNFWYVDALAAVGRPDQVREPSFDGLSRRDPFGTMSEDVDAVTGQSWGSVPQTTFMAGMLGTAMRLSQSWEDAWCHAL